MQLNGKTLRVIFLIVVPSLTAVFSYVYGYYYFGILSTGNYFYLSSNHIAFVTLASALACYIVVIIYGVYPLIFTAEKYIKKQGYQNVVTEFEFIKKILFIGIPIMIILTATDRLFTYLQINYYLISHYLLLYDFSFAILASSIAVVISALLRIATQVIKKRFRFYLAMGYSIVAANKKWDDDKIKYLFLSLDSYNKYLLRKINFGIKNINKIYSDIIYADAKKKDEIIKSVCESLGGDRLKLAIYLSTSYKVPDTEQFFIKESLVQKVRAFGAFLAAAVPIVISIIQLISKGG
jgi:hypothetical protein